MRFRFASLALLGLTIALGAGQAPAADKSTKPTLVVRVAALDTLVADVKYLFEVAGKAEEAKQIEAALKGYTGDKGIEGLDTTKPIGAYGRLTADITSSEGVILIPVAKPKVLLDYLGTKGIKPDEPKDGLYKAEVENSPLPVFFRFANGYAYVTIGNPDFLDPEKLLKPEVVFAATPAATLSVTLHIDEVPAELKKIVLNQAELMVEEGKKAEKDNANKLEAAFKGAVADEMFELLKSVVDDGGPVSLVFDIDRANDQLVFSTRFAGAPNSPLAGRIARLSQGTSLAPALLAPTSASYVGGSLSLPEKLRKNLIPMMDQGFKKVLEEEKNKDHRDLMNQVFKALSPTLQAAELDAALDLRGPSSKDLYTLVSAVKVQNGNNLEKVLKLVLDKAPQAEKAGVKLDVDKVGTVNVHSIEIPGNGEEVENMHKLLGTRTVYLAFRDDAVFVAAGENALPALKAALAVSPKPGPIFRLESSMSRLGPMLAKDQKKAPEIIKEVFKVKGSDRISVTLEGGKELNLKMAMKIQVVAFFAKMIEAQGKGL